MLSSWNISWPNNVSMLRQAGPQEANASASATDTAQGMLDTCTTTSRVEGPFPVPGEFLSSDAGVQEEQHDVEEIAETRPAGRSSSDLQSARLAPFDEAEAMHSASLLGASPGPAGQMEPLPTSVPEDIENSGCSMTVHSLEVATKHPSSFHYAREEKEKRQLWPSLSPPGNLWEHLPEVKLPTLPALPALTASTNCQHCLLCQQ